MKNKIGIIGYGELGKQIEAYLIEDGVSLSDIYYFDDIQYANKNIKSYPFAKYIEQEFSDYDFYIGLGYNELNAKEEVLTNLQNNKRKLPVFIHKSSYVHPSAKIGQGVIIYPLSCIDKEVVIEDSVLINNACVVSHNTRIKKCSFLAPSVAIAGNCIIGTKNFIGINSTIIDGIFIGDNITIGGGSVVIRNVEFNGVYVGNPLKRIK